MIRPIALPANILSLLLRRSTILPNLGIMHLADKVSPVLSRRGLTLRVTAGGASVVLGNRAGNRGSVEFEFATSSAFIKVFAKARLMNFAFAYIEGDMKVHGPLAHAIEILDAINSENDRRRTLVERLRGAAFRVSKWLVPGVLTRFESLDHYSLSSRAYELILDKHLQYTCGRFQTGNESIDEAQIAKFHLIATAAEKQLGTLTDKTHLDIGCGWGGMGAYFEREFRMHSLGNTNTPVQADYARRRFGHNVVSGDFLALSALDENFDLITVVGMIEHLTPHRRSQLLDVVRRRLAPKGLFYLQCITKPEVWIGGDAYRVAQKEVFPGHYLETADETELRLSKAGFEVIDRFEHSSDYGITTKLWAERAEAHEQELIGLMGARQYRLYVGYLAYASHLFFTGRGALMRYTLRKRL